VRPPGGKLSWLKNKYGYYESLQMLLDLQVELIYNEHNDLFVNDEQALEEISIIVKGWELEKICSRNRHLSKS
jgi:hypothetical protein